MLSSVSLRTVLSLVLALAFGWGAIAHAQTPADDQYGSPTVTDSNSNSKYRSGPAGAAGAAFGEAPPGGDVATSEGPAPGEGAATSEAPAEGEGSASGDSGLWEFGLLVAGAAVLASLYLILRVMPGLSLALQRRAMSFLVLAGLLLAAAEILYAFVSTSPTGAPLELGRLVAGVAIVVCLVAAGRLLRRSELQEVGPLRRSADLDPLTVLSNQAFFRRAAQRRVSQAGRYGLPLSLAMIDVDDFKEYNDLFGHEAGNAVLVRIAGVLRRSARADDLVARYGGEEFMMLLSSGHKDAEEALERIRLHIEVRCSPDEQIRRQVTVSAGVASLSRRTRTLEELIEAADESMYQAKRAGKNRVIGAEDVA